MVIRAHIHDDVPGMSIDVSLIMHPTDGSGDPYRILRMPGADQVYGDWEPIQPGTPVVSPTFRVTSDEGRALLEALAGHFHGTGDALALRCDYNDERKRVDKLTDALISVAGDLARVGES